MEFQEYKIRVVLLLICIGLFSQCVVTPDPNTGDPNIPGGICFEGEILPLLVSRCGNPTCHNSTDKADGIDLTTYDEILKEVDPGKADNSDLIESLYETGDERMPVPPLDPLSDAQITLLENWVNAGAFNTQDCNSMVCDTTSSISFSTQVIPILDLYCYGCHSDADPQGGYSYSSYDKTLKSVNDGTLLGSINFNAGFVAMPDEGSKMPDCQILILSKWIDQGFPNN